jgi:tripartite-type tricarboxylate transporter receptor subunit TctC
MQKTRRRFCKTTIFGASPLAALGSSANSQQVFPDKPIQVVVPFAAGSANDVVNRVITQAWSKELGVPLVVENVAGAGGAIGTQKVVRAAPSGLTILYANVTTLAIYQYLYSKPLYDSERDLALIGRAGFNANALLVRSNYEADSARQLIAMAKARPGKLNFGSGGVGTTGHLCGELMKSMSSTFALHIPYRSGQEAMQDMLGGQIDYMFDNLITAQQFIKAGKVKALAVTSLKRSPILPDVPTLDETGLRNFEAVGWAGFAAPRGTSESIISTLNRSLRKALADPALLKSFATFGVENSPSSAEEFSQFARNERTKWSKVIKQAGLKLDNS